MEESGHVHRINKWLVVVAILFRGFIWFYRGSHKQTTEEQQKYQNDHTSWDNIDIAD